MIEALGYVDLTPEEVLAAIRSAFPNQVAKARMRVEVEVIRQWHDHQDELGRRIQYYSEGDDGSRPQYDGMTLQSAIIAVLKSSYQRNGML